jgi:hypothetical protein
MDVSSCAGQAVGREISQDPLGFAAGDTNFYRYVRNRPTDLIDPEGTLPRSICIYELEAPQTERERIVALVGALTNRTFAVREKADAAIREILGKPPRVEIVDILENDEAINELRKDPEVANRLDQMLRGVPYRREEIQRLVKELANVDVKDPQARARYTQAFRTLRDFLDPKKNPEIAGYVRKIIENDLEIQKLRKEKAIGQQVDRLLK